MDQLREFWAMGGHGAFVWPAFAVTIGILVAMALQAWLARRKLQRQLAALQEVVQPRIAP